MSSVWCERRCRFLLNNRRHLYDRPSFDLHAAWCLLIWPLCITGVQLLFDPFYLSRIPIWPSVERSLVISRYVWLPTVLIIGSHHLQDLEFLYFNWKNSDFRILNSTTLLSLSDHYILSREWRVIVDQVQTNYHRSPNSAVISQVWPSWIWIWWILIIFGCVLSQLKPSELYTLSCGRGLGLRPRPFLQLRV